MKKLIIGLSVLLGLALVAGLGFFVFCLNHVDVNEVGVAYNSANGNLSVQEHPGWYVTSPLTRVVTLSTLPHVVHLPSDARVINTKIVRLKASGVIDFVKMQGFSYNLSGGLENILMGYAFSGQQFSFLEIVQQGGPEAK